MRIDEEKLKDESAVLDALIAVSRIAPSMNVRAQERIGRIIAAVAPFIASDPRPAIASAAEATTEQCNNASRAYHANTSPKRSSSMEDHGCRVIHAALTAIRPAPLPDAWPVLTVEGVDEIPDDVCKAVWDGYHPPGGANPSTWGRAILRSVATHCCVPQPSSDSGQLEAAEADRIIGEAINATNKMGDLGPAIEVRKAVQSLRSRLVPKPRRLTDEEAQHLCRFAYPRLATREHAEDGHAIAAEVARLWGLEVPAEQPKGKPVKPVSFYAPTHFGLLAFIRDNAPEQAEWRRIVREWAWPNERPSPAEQPPARAISDEEAEKLTSFAAHRNMNTEAGFVEDGRAIYAEALRLAGRTVEQSSPLQCLIDMNRVVGFLNEVLLMDERAIWALFLHRVPCNQHVIDHPTVQVAEDGTLGLLGLLNGLFARNGQAIAAEYDDEDDRYVHIRRFTVIPMMVDVDAKREGPVVAHDDDDTPTLGEVMRCVWALTRLATHLVGKGGAK